MFSPESHSPALPQRGSPAFAGQNGGRENPAATLAPDRAAPRNVALPPLVLQKAPAPPSQAPPAIAPRAPSAAGSGPPAPQIAPLPSSDYLRRLVAYLNGYKNYPHDARQRREQGVVRLHFVMDRSGRVLSYDVVGSSGSVALDEAARDLIRRAQPLPPVPADYPGDTLDLIVPVVFSAALMKSAASAVRPEAQQIVIDARQPHRLVMLGAAAPPSLWMMASSS